MLKDQKITEWVQIFLKYIDKRTISAHVSEDEGYKFQNVDQFQKNFDIDADNLAENLEASIAKDNLVVGFMYFPLKMLLIYATEYEDQTREILRNLFDESKDISDRINKLGWSLMPDGLFKRLLGIVLIIAGFMIVLGLDKILLGFLVENGWYDFQIQLESLFI